MPEFGVHGARMDGSEAVIIGRCYRGKIKKGDVFLLLKSSDAPCTAVRLSVNRLMAYGRDLDEIDEGLTAELRLSGQGGDMVRAETVLSTG